MTDPKPLVIFDDRCGFCKEAVALLRKLDRRAAFRYGGSSEESVLREAGVSPAEADEELKLAADGRLFGGYDAVAEIVRRLPGGRIVAPVMLAPPVRWLGRRIYRRVAASRRCTYSPAG